MARMNSLAALEAAEIAKPCAYGLPGIAVPQIHSQTEQVGLPKGLRRSATGGP